MHRIVTNLCLFAALATSVAARADDLYSYSYTGQGISGAGTFTIPSTTTDGTFVVSSITGQVNGTSITSLLAVNAYKDNDNLFSEAFPYVDGDGVSFSLDGGADVNIFYSNGDYFFQGDSNFVLGGGGFQPNFRPSFLTEGAGDTTIELNSFSFALEPVAATPEPSSIALLGTGVLGAVGMARRRYARK